MFTILLETTKEEKDYELLDSGDGEKLERYGGVVLSRPDPQALWQKRLDQEWRETHASFLRDSKNAEWKFHRAVPKEWEIDFADLRFIIKPSAFKHTGLFPEQKGNWDWMRRKVESRKLKVESVNVLNLFGYTGGATLACAQAGASVCHVDGSKAALNWAKRNAEASGLGDKPIRWILDDAVKFVKREIKRGKKYDGIIMDPPAFGHGPGGELWKIEEHFLILLELCKQVLSDKPLFFLINGYASGYSTIAYRNNLLHLIKKYGGMVESGELTIQESGKDGRLLPCGIFARWSR